MPNRRLKAPPIVLGPDLAASEHAKVIISIANELRINFARVQNIPIKKVKLEITVDRRTV